MYIVYEYVDSFNCSISYDIFYILYVIHFVAS